MAANLRALSPAFEKLPDHDRLIDEIAEMLKGDATITPLRDLVADGFCSYTFDCRFNRLDHRPFRQNHKALREILVDVRIMG